MAKNYHEIRINSRVLRVNKREWKNFTRGFMRWVLSGLAVLFAWGIGAISARIEQGYYPVPIRDTTVTVGDAITCLIILVALLPIIFYLVAYYCDWDKKEGS